MSNLASPPKPTDYRFIDLEGKSFGRFTVIGYAGQAKPTGHRWVCRCSCGIEKTVDGGNLKSGQSKSCGCAWKDFVPHNKRHGESHHTTEYRIWTDMRTRCNNPRSRAWIRYGGRGIKVCKRWDIFENFLADVGRRPSLLHSLDRLDNNGDYEPGNVRWSNKSEQAVNRRTTRWLTLDEQTKPMGHWAKERGLYPATIRRRLSNGYPTELALMPGRLPIID